MYACNVFDNLLISCHSLSITARSVVIDRIKNTKNHSNSKSTVKSYWMVGTTLLINFRNTKRH